MTLSRPALRRPSLVLAGLSLLALGLTACSDDASGEAADCSVGFANPTGQNTYTGAVVDALKTKVEARGCSFTELDAKLDVSQQISDVQTLITQDVDALVIYPLDYDSVKNVLTKASDAGIAVFGDNADIDALGPDAPAAPLTGQLIDAHLSEDFIRARFDFLAETLPGGAGDVVYIGFGGPVAPLDKEWELVQEVAADYPDINVLERINNPTDDVAGAQSPAAAALSKYPDLDAFVSYNDPTAVGAAAAIKNAGKQASVISIGAQLQPEGLTALENGSLAASWDFTPVDMGAKLADLVIASLDGDDEAAAQVVSGGFELYTAENVGDFVSNEDKLADLKAAE